MISLIDHALLPSPASARLPQTYESARDALTNCASIDECMEWADKAAALASYARQADDQTLLKLATRIRARASRRAGELLKQFDARPQNAAKQTAVGGHLISRADAGASAGMSERQVKTAVNHANVPEAEFEAAVESDNPPTQTALAEMGRKPRAKRNIVELGGRDPKTFNKCLHFVAALEQFVETMGEYDIAAILPFLDEQERATARASIAKIHAVKDMITPRL